MDMQTYSDADPMPVSTGHLPAAATVQMLVEAAHARYKPNLEGVQADYYPALAQVPADLFGICIAAIDGALFSAGDTLFPFTIMSVSKPFIFALICQVHGAEQVRQKLGVNSTGLPFNSILAVELNPSRLTNPMVNPGAIAATSLVPGASTEAKWQFIYQGLARFAGRELTLNEEVYRSASASNQRNQVIARLLASYDRIYDDPLTALDLYTRQCSLDVTATDLAVMAATLADGGVNPITKEEVIDRDVCPPVLAVMATAGMYETSGDWLYEVGLPGKSGVGGGIITIAPGKGGMGTFSPKLDRAGNSVRGQLATKYLSTRLGLNIFASEPDSAIRRNKGRGSGETPTMLQENNSL
jgi:glutaminase